MIATFNVVGLYTNIPHDFGHEAVNIYLSRQYDENPHSRFSKQFILELIDFMLKYHLYF